MKTTPLPPVRGWQLCAPSRGAIRGQPSLRRNWHARQAIFEDRIRHAFLVRTMKEPFGLKFNERGVITPTFGQKRERPSIVALSRLTKSGKVSLRQAVNEAAKSFTGEHLRAFIKGIGIWIKDGGELEPERFLNLADLITFMVWDGFDIFPSPSEWLRFPPLSRWALPAARECVAFLSTVALELDMFDAKSRGRGFCYMPDYTTYRQRLRRVGLRSQRPILVTKAKFDRSGLHVTLAAT